MGLGVVGVDAGCMATCPSPGPDIDGPRLGTVAARQEQ